MDRHYRSFWHNYSLSCPERESSRRVRSRRLRGSDNLGSVNPDLTMRFAAAIAVVSSGGISEDGAVVGYREVRKVVMERGSDHLRCMCNVARRGLV